MELIRTIREKNATARQRSIEEEASDVITLSDFDSDLFVAYNGIPLVPINKEWTTKEIVQQLSLLRQNYVNAKMRKNS